MTAALRFTPTPSQATAIKALAMLVSTEKRKPTLVIEGFAGSGKTSLMKAFCDTADDMGVGVVLLAPTGRAAKILASYTGRNAFTIHRIIYRQVDASQDAPFSRSFNRWKRAIFIIDEASMVGDSYDAQDNGRATAWGEGRLLTDVVDFVFSQEGSKLVLIGDPDQLPPVGCDSSPALNVDYLRSLGLTVGRVKLTDVVRQQSGSMILTNAMALRGIVDSETTDTYVPTLLVKSGSDVETSSGETLLEQIEASYSRYGLQDAVIITRSNKRATQYNIALRSQVLGYDDLLVKGDLLIVNKNNYLWSERAGCDFIANGDIAEVVSIRERSEMHGLHFADVSLRLIDRNGIDIDCKILLDMLTADVDVSDEDTRQLKCTSTSDIYNMLSKGSEADYGHYTNQRKKALDIRKDPWLNALQVRFAYALTCHKAQGGQWGSVFLDPGYIPPESSTVGLSRWLYTAISRARRHLYLINYPAVESL